MYYITIERAPGNAPLPERLSHGPYWSVADTANHVERLRALGYVVKVSPMDSYLMLEAWIGLQE